MIEVKNLVKHYGSLKAVDDISFTVDKGCIMGFLGPNGAGKSTTLKVLTGYLPATSGTVLVGGHNVSTHSLQVRRLIGYLPEQNPLYQEMVVHDFLHFIAEIRGMEKTGRQAAVTRAVELTGLEQVVHQPIYTLSKGYKQRTGLAQAIIHNPDILILDEPTSGLDPNQIVEIRELIRTLGREKTLIISSHILQEVQAVCDRVMIINKGRLVANDSTGALEESFGGHIRLAVVFTGDPALLDNLNLTGLTRVELEQLPGGEHSVQFEHDRNEDLRPALLSWFAASGLNLLELKRQQFSLEEVFKSLTGESGVSDTESAAPVEQGEDAR